MGRGKWQAAVSQVATTRRRSTGLLSAALLGQLRKRSCELSHTEEAAQLKAPELQATGRRISQIQTANQGPRNDFEKREANPSESAQTVSNAEQGDDGKDEEEVKEEVQQTCEEAAVLLTHIETLNQAAEKLKEFELPKAMQRVVNSIVGTMTRLSSLAEMASSHLDDLEALARIFDSQSTTMTESLAKWAANILKMRSSLEEQLQNLEKDTQTRSKRAEWRPAVEHCLVTLGILSDSVSLWKGQLDGSGSQKHSQESVPMTKFDQYLNACDEDEANEGLDSDDDANPEDLWAMMGNFEDDEEEEEEEAKPSASNADLPLLNDTGLTTCNDGDSAVHLADITEEEINGAGHEGIADKPGEEKVMQIGSDDPLEPSCIHEGQPPEAEGSLEQSLSNEGSSRESQSHADAAPPKEMPSSRRTAQPDLCSLSGVMEKRNDGHLVITELLPGKTTEKYVLWLRECKFVSGVETGGTEKTLHLEVTGDFPEDGEALRKKLLLRTTREDSDSTRLQVVHPSAAWCELPTDGNAQGFQANESTTGTNANNEGCEVEVPSDASNKKQECPQTEATSCDVIADLHTDGEAEDPFKVEHPQRVLAEEPAVATAAPAPADAPAEAAADHRQRLPHPFPPETQASRSAHSRPSRRKLFSSLTGTAARVINTASDKKRDVVLAASALQYNYSSKPWSKRASQKRKATLRANEAEVIDRMVSILVPPILPNHLPPTIGSNSELEPSLAGRAFGKGSLHSPRSSSKGHARPSGHQHRHHHHHADNGKFHTFPGSYREARTASKQESSEAELLGLLEDTVEENLPQMPQLSSRNQRVPPLQLGQDHKPLPKLDRTSLSPKSALPPLTARTRYVIV